MRSNRYSIGIYKFKVVTGILLPGNTFDFSVYNHAPG